MENHWHTAKHPRLCTNVQKTFISVQHYISLIKPYSPTSILPMSSSVFLQLGMDLQVILCYLYLPKCTLIITSVLWWHDFPFISLKCGLLSQYRTVLGWTLHVPTTSPPTHFKNIINLNLIAWVFTTNECYLTAVFCWPPAQPFQSLMTLVLTYSLSLPCPVFLLGKLIIHKEEPSDL